jgi:hypothetical protein
LHLVELPPQPPAIERNLARTSRNLVPLTFCRESRVSLSGAFPRFEIEAFAIRSSAAASEPPRHAKNACLAKKRIARTIVASKRPRQKF